MIYENGLESIIEALYLGECVSKIIGKSNIRVNPVFDKLQLDYTIGKTIILNDCCTDIELVKQLVKNNTVISRVSNYNSIDGVIFQPYIIRINFKVMWNGDEIDASKVKFNTSREFCKKCLGNIDSFDITLEKPLNLFFPKILNIDRSILLDSEGYVNSLGWLLHQVGQNIDKNTKFMDLDLIKTKKLQMRSI